MSQAEHRRLRQAIVAKLKSIAGIGQVYDYERYRKDEKAFREAYASAGVVRGWHVRRVARVESAATNDVMTTWEIRGFRSLADETASELEFDDLIDRIGDAFRADPTLGGLVLYAKRDGVAVPELTDSGPVLFCGVLCHGAKLKWVSRHGINAGRPWE